MRQKLAQFSAGSAAVVATLVAVHGFVESGGSGRDFRHSLDRSRAVLKQKGGSSWRAGAQRTNSSVVFYTDPNTAMTIATKIEADAKA